MDRLHDPHTPLVDHSRTQSTREGGVRIVQTIHKGWYADRADRKLKVGTNGSKTNVLKQVGGYGCSEAVNRPNDQKVHLTAQTVPDSRVPT